MCGINGFIDHTNTIEETDLRKASRSLKHQGSDDDGLWFEKKEHYALGLSNQRLATIDLNSNAAQPLTSSCGQYVITFNGTIYNYLKLRENLIKYGIIFSTLSDTEVILESYKKWGNKSFEMLDGAFTFAIVDKKLNLLLIARDDLGAKPLYFVKQKDFYAFSSEIRGLLNYPTIKKEINKNALASYFRYGYFIGEETIYQQIFKFKKGNLTTIDLHSGNSYESALIKIQAKPIIINKDSEDLIVSKIEDLLTESILKRNQSNVPIGVLLNGGYDSTTVAAILQNNQTKKIKTYTVSFKNSKLDEAPRAKQIAEHLKTNHQEYYLDELKAVDIIKDLPEALDEPIGDSSAISMLFLASKLKDEIKVLLSAEGGDELFGGSRTYVKALKIDDLAKKSNLNWIKKLAITLSKRWNPKMKEIIEAENLMEKYLAVNACFTKIDLNLLLNGPFIQEQHKEIKAEDIKDLLTYDLNNYLPNSILLKNERCFNYYGIDNRDALLKKDLIKYLYALSPKLFFKDGMQKYLLKQITQKYIPKNLMNEPKKSFIIPLANWLNSTLKPMLDFYLSDAKLKEHNLLDLQEVSKIRNSFNSNSTPYNAQKLWLILQFQMWYNRWMA